MKTDRFARFAPAAGASAVTVLMAVTRPLGAAAKLIAAGCCVGAWAAVVLFRRRELRAHGSAVLALAAVISAGQVRAGATYGVAAAAVLFACLVTMRQARSGLEDAPARPAGRVHVPARSVIALGVVGAIVAATLLASLPPVGAVVERWIVHRMFGGGEETTAFSTTMALGSTRGMLLSNEIVLRIEGERPDYLRGAVYDRYDGHFWVMSGSARTLHTVRADAPADAETTTITLVRGAPNGADMRWFLPAGACDLGLTQGSVELDRFAIARRGIGEDPPSIHWHRRRCATPPPAAARPTAMDLDLYRGFGRTLAPIARDFTAGATTPREKLDAIERRLGTFEYSIDAVTRDPRLDPIVDFLTRHKVGHCEMFASATVLLARASGIPARVVGGYRVSEVNPITGRAVVRDRDAHAWVEAWIDDAWHASDPTPVSDALAPRTSWLSHLGDLLSTVQDRGGVVLARLGTLGTAGALSLVVVALLAIRWLTQIVVTRVSRRREAKLDRPLPCFEALALALEERGIARRPDEPIELLARRAGGAAAAALQAYAALRYGGVGDESAVVRAVEDAARAARTTSFSRAPP